MSMYNLLENSSYYSGATGSLWFYSKVEADDFGNAIANTDAFKSFKYKTKLIVSTILANEILEDTTIAVSLKYLINFWRSLEISLIKCKVDL